jgi:DNA-directed RNA polymerase subunit RPC12/RpoP
MKKWKANKNTSWVQCPYCKSYDIIKIVTDNDEDISLLCLNCGRTEKGDELFPIVCKVKE